MDRIAEIIERTPPVVGWYAILVIAVVVVPAIKKMWREGGVLKHVAEYVLANMVITVVVLGVAGILILLAPVLHVIFTVIAIALGVLLSLAAWNGPM